VEAILKRKYREAMRAANRARDQQPDDDAEETRNWFDEWAARPAPQQEQTNTNQRSQE
jgi:hypothetical protein